MLRTAGRIDAAREPSRDRKPPHRGHVIHDVDGAGPIYAAATGPDGRRYFSDEHHHRVVVEEPTGYRWSFGTLGSGPGELRHPRGLALLPGRSVEETRLFVCDAWNHRVQVFDGNGRFCFAFGSAGAGEGQFDVPSDVAIVRPHFDGEDVDGAGDTAHSWLAVADRWNNRVQVFEPDGAFVGAIGGARSSTKPRECRDGAGWPFFRLGCEPALWFPVRLGWKDGRLEVVSANGLTLQIDLARALLPDFQAWGRSATVADLEAARAAFSAADRAGAIVPADILAAIETELGIKQLAAGRWGEAQRVWARPWPGTIPARAVERQLHDRVDALERRRDARPRRLAPLAKAVSSRVEMARRLLARRAAAELLADERRRTADRPAAATVRYTPSLEAYAGLAARLSALAGAREPEALVAWSAPPAAGELRHLAVGHGVLAVVSGREPAVWLFDGRCVPQARFSLPAGTWPHGIAAGPGGGWYVTDLQHDCVFQLDENGKVVRVWGGRGDGPDRLHRPLGLAAAGSRLFVADRDNDRVEVYDTLGHPLGAFPRLGAPTAVAIDGRTLWLAEWRGPQLRRIDVRTGATLAVLQHPALASPASVAVGPRTILVADALGAAIHAFDRRGRWQGRLSRAGRGPIGRLAGVAIVRGLGVAVDCDRGQLLRFALPRGAGAWQPT